MVVYLTELIPAEVRATGFSLAYSVAAIIFGGFTPAICTYLIHLTGNSAAPGIWMSFTAFVGIAATFVSGHMDATPAMPSRRIPNVNN
jgi:hypothetical protein